jgi:hypothetical protein
MSAIILRRAVLLTGKTFPRFNHELRDADIDPPGTLPLKKSFRNSFIPPFDLRHREIEPTFAPEAKTTPFVTTSHQMPQEGTVGATRPTQRHGTTAATRRTGSGLSVRPRISETRHDS